MLKKYGKNLGAVILVMALVLLSLPANAFAATFTVPKPVSLTVNPTNVSMTVGEVKPFQATVIFSNGSTIDASRNAVFIISNSRVVSVKNGSLVALNPGNATVTIRSYGLTGKINVTVTNQSTTQNPVVQPAVGPVFSPPRPVSLVVNPTNVTLKVGEVKPFQATVTFSNGSTIDASRNAVFTISNARVVTVKNGALVALSPGSATVTINSYGLVGRINVSVVNNTTASTSGTPQTWKPPTTVPVPVALEISPSSVTLQQGQSVPVRVLVRYSNGSVQDITSLCSYNAVHARLANGVLTGVAPGQGVFHVDYNGLKATLAVKVEPKPITINIKPPSLDPALGVERKTLTWDFRGTQKLEVAVPQDLLRWDREVQQLVDKFYKSDAYTQQTMLAGMSPELRALVLAPSSSNGYNVVPWVNEPYNLSYLKQVANTLETMASGMNLNRYLTATLALKMVQSIPYHVTPAQMPSQTLIEGGDCDAKSVLLASLLKLMGYDVALLQYDPATLNSTVGHMQVGVVIDESELPNGGPYKYVSYGGKKYYIMETTAKALLIGMSPYNVPPTAVYPVN